VRKFTVSVLTLLVGIVAVTGCSDGGPTNPAMEMELTPSLSVVIVGTGSTPLIAGQHYEVGTVEVWNDATNLYVTYNVDAGWLLCEAHLAVADKEEDIPQTKKGNPIPGQFQFGGEFDPCLLGSKTFTIPLADLPDVDDFTIAAHAVVAGVGSCQEPADVLAGLPTAAYVCVNKGPKEEGPLSYYFPEVVLTTAGMLNGTYGGWCIDLDLGIEPPQCFNASVSLADPATDFPFIANDGNLDLVNWMLNQDLLAAPYGYTMGEIQRAIWVLLEGSDPGNVYNTAPATAANVGALVALAQAEGEGFTPACGEYTGIVLEEVTGPDYQPLIVPYLIECECTPGGDETAWGQGTRFVQKGNWGMYFDFVPVI
jgi:hypothetical protein